MYKKNGRVTFRSNRRQNYKRSNYSNGKSRNKGNVLQQYQKYLKLAKEASSSGDRVQSEYYYQFTDHYSRIMIETGISFGENEPNNDVSDSNSVEKNEDVDASNVSEVQASDSSEEETSNKSESDHGSIESVSFLSEPAKKKPKKLKKEKI
tara:strand:- start:1382 stop:1834 length:453 start_codon:yes stop_codon:yes gene_type:complete